MLTTQFKTTLATGAAVVIAGALFVNQAIQGKQIQVLRDQQMDSVKVEKVIVTASPTSTPSATVTPTRAVFFGPARPTTVPTK